MCGALMKRLTATVAGTEYVGEDIVIVYFTVLTEGTFTYGAGQYITVYFEDSSTPAGKAYSLSSAPHETTCSITVKKVGEFSGKLYALKTGDTFEISEAYGHFNPNADMPIVALGAGVGIAPIWSVLKHELKVNSGRTATLFYSNPTYESIAHYATIEAHASNHLRFVVKHHITRCQVPIGMHAGRIDIDECIGAVEDKVQYLVCGSVAFVRTMWRGLVERGVAVEYIHTETFFE
jgi:ferredoxin-NADP reductase